jgi:DNA (cytosine-5)-methyltransferase 1
MPVRRTKSGGYKYGKSGKTYYGKGAKSKATKQGRAIKISQKRLVKELDIIKHSYSNNRLSEWDNRNVESNNICPTLSTRCDCLGVVVKEDTMNNLRIRKLTPKECFRLMGVKDEDSDKLNHLSNATKYHLAGDSIVVNVLQAIFKSILIDNLVLEDKPIRLIELFGGYGSQALALKYLNIPFEHWKLCEWAIKSIDAYKHIHYDIEEDYSDLMDKDDLVEYLYNKGISSNWNEPMKLESIKRKSEQELRDIYNNCKITHNLINIQQAHAKDFEIKDREIYNYIMTYSFPCQDLSLAGKGLGMEKGSGTRSGMLWEVERILDECGEELPQMLLMENVPQVVGKKNKEDFDKWISFLESKGYTNEYCMLNSKEVGYPEPVPQNRNRCFMISVLNPKQDIVFPEVVERKTTLKDLLEDDVDEKYYLSDKMLDYCMGVNQKESKFPRQERFLQTLENTNYKGIASTITTNTGQRPTDNFVFKDETVCEIRYDEGIRTFKDNVCGSLRTIDACGDKCLLIKNATKQGYLEATVGDGIDISSRMQYHRGNVQKESCQTITTSGGNDRGVVIENKWSDLD